MSRWIQFVACLVLMMLPNAAPAQDAGKAERTVVLVHGAFADGSSWDKVIPLLQAKGLKVVAVHNPLTSLADDVAATNAAWKTKPSWFIVAEKDRMIQPNLERAMAKKINATIIALPASHVAMRSRPKDVAAIILAAADKVRDPS